MNIKSAKAVFFDEIICSEENMEFIDDENSYTENDSHSNSFCLFETNTQNENSLDNSSIEFQNNRKTGLLGPKTRELFKEKIQLLKEKVKPYFYENYDKLAPKTPELVMKTFKCKIPDLKTSKDMSEEENMIEVPDVRCKVVPNILRNRSELLECQKQILKTPEVMMKSQRCEPPAPKSPVMVNPLESKSPTPKTPEVTKSQECTEAVLRPLEHEIPVWSEEDKIIEFEVTEVRSKLVPNILKNRSEPRILKKRPKIQQKLPETEQKKTNSILSETERNVSEIEQKETGTELKEPEFKRKELKLETKDVRPVKREPRKRKHEPITETEDPKTEKKARTKVELIRIEMNKRRQLNDVLYQWFLRERYRGNPLNDSMIQKKAITFKEKLGGTEFTPTNEWFQQWKSRYDVKLYSEDFTEDNVTAEFIKKFKELVSEKGYTKEQIFNCGVTGLNYRLLPTKKLDMKLSEECNSRYWDNSDRLSFMCCSNASGSIKFPLMVIGTPESQNKSRVMPQDLRVDYQQHPKGWIDSSIFIRWFHNCFVPSIFYHFEKKSIPKKVLLLLDIAPFYPPKNFLESDDVTILFLPSDVRPIIQPNQQYLESIKTRYRFRLLSNICQSLEDQNSKDFIQCLKEVELADVFNLLSQAWKDISVGTIQDSWNELLSNSSNAMKIKGYMGNEQLKILNGKSLPMKQLFNICSTIDDLENVCRTDVELWSERDDQTMCSFDDQSIIDYTLKHFDNNDAIILQSLTEFKTDPEKILTENFQTSLIEQDSSTSKEAKSRDNIYQNLISASTCKQYLTEVINYFKTQTFENAIAKEDIEILERFRDKVSEAK